MIVVMKPAATQMQVDHVVKRIEALGLRSHIIVGTERTVVAAVGSKRDTNAREALSTIDGVDSVVPILAPYKVASIEVQSERTVVNTGSLSVGGPQDRRHRRPLLGRK